jgi:vacuolar-type H+-ATPase subunit I/STV1
MGKRPFRLQGGGLKERMLDKRIEKLSQENAALKEQAKALSSEMEAERANQSEILKALKGRGQRRGTRVLRLGLATGVAYILGAKAGRRRYEQISGWWASIRDRNQTRAGGALDVGRAAGGKAQ